MGQGLLGSNQLTTIDQSELSAQLGLGLGGGNILQRPQSPENPLSATASPTSSLQDDDMDDFRRVSLKYNQRLALTCLKMHLIYLLQRALLPPHPPSERPSRISGLSGRLPWSHLPRSLPVWIPAVCADLQRLLCYGKERRSRRGEEGEEEEGSQRAPETCVGLRSVLQGHTGSY